MKIFKGLFFTLALILSVSACKKDDDGITPPEETTSFRITLTSTINLLASHVFNTPDGADAPGPIATQGGSYTTTFSAVPGARLNFVSMLANSNDWFFAAGQNGFNLFDADGNPITGDITSNIRLYDAGTEEEDPTTIATEPDGGVNGAPDDDTTVRTQQQDVSNYLSGTLAYANGEFTFTITKNEDGVITPGIIVIHALDNPLFVTGEPDWGQGLKLLAEAGNPSELSAYINEEGTAGAPLRLSTSHSPFSPAVVYAFNSEKDPLFTQGEAAKVGSGLEELAEDGNNEIIYEYLKDLGLPVAKSNEAGGIGPGGSFTFDLEVPNGYKLGLATMFVQSNDWVVAFNNNGADLFDSSGNPNSGLGESVQLYLFDVGTEIDEEVGSGANQAPRQSSPDSGADDPDNTIRRVGEIEDVQFGKGLISSPAGVVALMDARGGYNFVQVDIQPK